MSDTLKQIFLEAKDCRFCYGATKINVPMYDPKNTSGSAQVVFIGERPGRQGAGKTNFISFDNDDPSANFFKECFLLTNLNRKNIFITNSCLCYPDCGEYKDTPPITKEIRNCQYWLNRQLKITNPTLIVTLGANALKAIKSYFPKSKQLNEFKLSRDIGKIVTDIFPFIYPLFHTSRLGRANRGEELQKKDWLRIPEILKSN
ncbi:MAG: hypothetical protein HXY50_07320 [Ignavibacteriaceae bacterium]|nr:hypothetical protein [Ignavibacteriaceae bacterium]